MQTICLVNPPSPFLLDERVFPPLGIARIAAEVEKAGLAVELLDLSGYKNYVDVVRDHARTSSAQCFGISATTPQMPAAALIAQAIRKIAPRKRIILGGPHATLVAAARKREQKLNNLGRAQRAFEQIDRHFDVIVAGDGERAIFEACTPSAPKLIDADGRHSTLFLTKDMLEQLPFPARHLLDLESYNYKVEGKRATSLIAQLGCPFGCGFCAGRLSPMLRHIRTRSTENIIEEMIHIHRTYGYCGFMFYDDELNVSKGMLGLMTRLTEVQKTLGVEWRLRGFVKAELFNEEQAEAMFRAGFRWILVGFESGAPRILDNINKRATQRDNTRCVEIAHRAGLKVKALMSLGHPGESSETIAETRKWLLHVQPEDFDAGIITPYPGSPYYDEAEETIPGVWVYRAPRTKDELFQEELDYAAEAAYYKGDPNDGYVSHVYTSHLDCADLVHERNRLEKDVREALGIPYNPSKPAMLYEHSMGQSSLPAHILRTTHTPFAA